MKKILFFITVFASLFIIKDLVYSIYTLWHKNDLLIVAQKQLSVEKKENLRLKQTLSEAEKSDFVESQARNKLFLVKPGENVVLLPKKTYSETKNEVVERLPHWQAWVNLFFPSTY